MGVSGRVHFKNGDRVSNVLIKQKFATRSVAIGKFIPVIGPNDSESGTLDWDVSKITWAAGVLPRDLLPGKSHRMSWSAIRILQIPFRSTLQMTTRQINLSIYLSKAQYSLNVTNTTVTKRRPTEPKPIKY